MEQVERIKEQEEREMRPLKVFFNRVFQIAAQSVQDLCLTLNINEEVSELIWSIVKVTLCQEISLLAGRHLDQLIMCVIYGVCKVHPNSVKPAQRSQMQLDRRTAAGDPPKVQFNDIINAYKEINKQRVVKAGHLQLNVMKSTIVSWVYTEVPLDPESQNP